MRSIRTNPKLSTASRKTYYCFVNPYYILDPKREYLFTGLEKYKDKINEFRPWLESQVTKK